MANGYIARQNQLKQSCLEAGERTGFQQACDFIAQSVQVARMEGKDRVMDRLTKHDKQGAYIDDQSVMWDLKRRGAEITRLAAYEDTGLEPREIDQFLQLGKMVTLDRLRELARADSEGLVVVLPCKVGDTVWRITGDGSVRSCPFWLCLHQDFGKTVFLAREEAEAALKEAEHEAD